MDMEAINQAQVNEARAAVLRVVEETGVGCTTLEEKQGIYLAAVRAFHEAGFAINEAYDLVFGVGAFKALAGDVWQTLRGVN